MTGPGGKQKQALLSKEEETQQCLICSTAVNAGNNVADGQRHQQSLQGLWDSVGFCLGQGKRTALSP